MRETEKYYFFYEHQFGQWTKRDITDPDGVTYNCCEQYMMVQKAKLFNDTEMAEKILLEVSPFHQQKLGRQVKNYQQVLWDQNKYGIVWYGNFLKFTQHSDFKMRLLATGDKMIAEASPVDLVWGIGLSADDDVILDETNWVGTNLLGKVLMSIRQTLNEY
jgi:ribA/ribD-fused uncharacterized protein